MNISVIENERFLIRPVVLSDKDQFMRIQQENSEMPNAYKEDTFRESFWEKCLEGDGDIYMMIFLKENGGHIGNCSFQNVNTDIIEIGIDIDKTMQNMGLGTSVLSLLVAYLRDHASDRKHRIKTKSNNIPCQKMIEKVGGVKVGEEATEFDLVMDKMLPTLRKYGMTEQIAETERMLDRNKGICTFIYEF